MFLKIPTVKEELSDVEDRNTGLGTCIGRNNRRKEMELHYCISLLELERELKPGMYHMEDSGEEWGRKPRVKMMPKKGEAVKPYLPFTDLA